VREEFSIEMYKEKVLEVGVYFDELEDLNEVMRVDEEIDDLLYNQLIDSKIVEKVCDSLENNNIAKYINSDKINRIFNINQ
jgi:hypothetical protein